MSMKKKGFRRPPWPDDRLTLKSEHIHDPYATRLKLHEPTICPDCGAVFHEGRWQWAARPEGAHEERCQACRRIHDHYPAGELVLSGAFVAGHKEEILRLARHEAEREQAEHPLHRLMGIEARDDGALVLATTDIHLPRRIGHALEHAFKGELELHYEEEAYHVRAHWRRDA
jgi:hypothetical protein